MEHAHEADPRAAGGPHPRWLPWAAAGLMAALACSDAGGPSPRPEVPIGARAAPFRFVDARFLPRTLDELGEARAYVITFSAADCPISQRYLPKLGELEREFRAQGARFLLIDVGPDASLVDAIGAALDAGIDYPVVRDCEGRAVAALAPARTPETILLDADLRVRYRGRVDDQYRLGGVRPAEGRDDLRLALAQVLAGEAVTVAETPVDGCLITPPRAGASRDATFTADVLPILAKRCQGCHGDPPKAPFPLLTYEDAGAHAEMIAEVVLQRRMPPWFADGRFGAWSNDPRLSSAEIRTLVDWVRGGTPRGAAVPAEPSAGPAAEAAPTPPGLTLYAGAFELPAAGFIPYTTVSLRDASGEVYRFPEDTWVASSAIVPSNPPSLHHARVGFGGITLGGYVPGTDALRLEPGMAFKIPRGTELTLALHQVATGRPESNAVSVELTFPAGRVTRQLRNLNLGRVDFKIPPGARSFELVAQEPLPCRARGVALFGHMHLRGRDMRFERLAPPGTEDPPETLLLIPNYSFDWQLVYYWKADAAPLFAPGGVLRCTAHYDNSAFNAFNPDPAATVLPGEQTENEMMLALLMYVDEDERLDLAVNPRTGRVVDGASPAGGPDGDR